MRRADLKLRALVLFLWGCAVFAQEASLEHEPVPRTQPAITPLREIYDPQTGSRWLLVSDTAHPGGPGRLLLVEPRSGGDQRALPIIHAGDSIVAEEHGAVVDARLQAIALGPAVQGGRFSARLRVGGRVVWLRAVAPDLAELLSGMEAGQ